MDPGEMFQYFMGLLIFVYLLLHVLIRSKFGRIAISIRENEVRTGLLGYDIRRYKLMVFSIGRRARRGVGRHVGDPTRPSSTRTPSASKCRPSA